MDRGRTKVNRVVLRRTTFQEVPTSVEKTDPCTDQFANACAAAGIS
jgi:hypothetical protein